MQALLATHAETADRRVICLSYTDERSANGNSYADMSLGRTHKMVGCNSDILDRCSAGDLVIVTAQRPTGRVFHIGILKKKVDVYMLWAEHGGEVWKYNWDYDPVTPDMDVHQTRLALIESGVARTQAYNLFNMRFCSAKCIPALARAFREGIVKVSI